MINYYHILNKGIIFYCIIITLFLNCTTNLIGTRKEPLNDEIIDQKIEIQDVELPTVYGAPSFEEITADTKINSDLVLRIVSLDRKRHYYNEIYHYKRKINPILKYASLFSSPSLSLAGLYGIKTGYVVLGKYLIGTGILTIIPGQDRERGGLNEYKKV